MPIIEYTPPRTIFIVTLIALSLEASRPHMYHLPWCLQLDTHKQYGQ